MDLHLFQKHGRVQHQWAFDARAPLVAAAAVMDLGDEIAIVLGTRDGRVECISVDGKARWTFSVNEQLSEVESYFVDTERVHGIDAIPTIGDVNGDGKPEIIVGTEMGRVYCIAHTGKLLWQYDTKAGIRAGATIADINGDGHPEVLIGNLSGALSVLTGKGTLLFTFNADAGIEATPCVLRKRDRSTLIVFGTAKGDLIAITPAQDIKWRVPLGDKITAEPAPLHHPEEERLIVGTIAGMLHCVSEHGEHVWQYKTQGSIYGKATIADLDGDGTPEVLCSSCDNTVYALTIDGKRLWSYETDFWVTASPIVTDLDGDGNLEVVVGSFDHHIYVLDSRGEYQLDYVPGLSGIVPQAGHYSNILTAEPGERTGKRLWQYKMDSIVVGTTLVPGTRPLVLVTTKVGHVHAIVHGT